MSVAPALFHRNFAAGSRERDVSAATAGARMLRAVRHEGRASGRGAAVIRVLLAEDVRMLREALVGVLNLADDIEVVSAVEAGDAIVTTALQVRPDVAVIDIELPGLDGISAAAQ